MRYLAHEDRKRNTSEEHEQIFAQFEDDMFVQVARIINVKYYFVFDCF